MFQYSRKQRAQTLITKLLASAAFFTPHRRYHQMRVERRFDQSIVWGKIAGMLLPSRTSVRRRDGYIPTSHGLAKGTPRAASSSWHSSPAGSYTIPPSIEERSSEEVIRRHSISHCTTAPFEIRYILHDRVCLPGRKTGIQVHITVNVREGVCCQWYHIS